MGEGTHLAQFTCEGQRTTGLREPVLTFYRVLCPAVFVFSLFLFKSRPPTVARAGLELEAILFPYWEC